LLDGLEEFEILGLPGLRFLLQFLLFRAELVELLHLGLLQVVVFDVLEEQPDFGVRGNQGLEVFLVEVFFRLLLEHLAHVFCCFGISPSYATTLTKVERLAFRSLVVIDLLL